MHHKLSELVAELINNDIDLQFAKKELESTYIREILKRHNGNIGLSAKALGMHRNTLSKRIKDLKIPHLKPEV
ncbi:Helix-turn-helix domain-containing protein [Sulfidibacter corallicola]|uniref:Helix-turn-helix domain-containing protein n=1 Tax=Sulfidibacter corallicola TaxID=2818388 RepID=A0A8A4TLC8_SULCO|nr:helix-turn-helix domain-containing protein [Sulfidibacter corallicola]QTD50799.1 helix-turn-helix domain-containing protein [Sulfidibacter corallicola]